MAQEKINCKEVGKLVGDKWEKLHDISRRVYSVETIAPTIHTSGGGNTEVKILVKEAVHNGYATAELGDSVNIAFPNSKTRRGRVGHGVAQTILAGDPQQVVIVEDEQNAKTICLNSKVDGKQPSLNDRVYDTNGVSTTIATSPYFTGSICEKNYRIRKLTERECFRLMGVKDQDFERVAKKQSTSSLYHLAGDSIVTTCLMAIFGELFQVDYRAKINELVEELKQ